MSALLEQLQTQLQQFSPPLRLLVGLSGGLDSVCLLHGIQRLRQRGELDCELRALHVNHGLQPEADKWQQFCTTYCAALNLPLTVTRLDLGDQHREGNLEAQARRERYREFERQLAGGEVLLLAHHLDDQIETLLLRLMRGAGIQGLSGMPARRPLGEGSLLRPLLGLTRLQLRDYANAQGLRWTEDPSNEDSSFDRNFCRHQLLPLIESRWPDYRDSSAKSLALLEEAESLLAELAGADLDRVLGGGQPAILPIAPLQGLGTARQRNLLRHWLKELGLQPPGWHRLQQLVREVIPSAADHNPELDEEAYRLCRFNGRLYALNREPSMANTDSQSWDPEVGDELLLPGNGVLQAKAGNELALDPGIGQLQVRYRTGGESLRMPGRPTKPLKEILREAQVEPWLRDRLPLLFRGHELVCVPDIGVAATCAAGQGGAGLRVHWRQPKLLAG